MTTRRHIAKVEFGSNPGRYVGMYYTHGNPVNTSSLIRISLYFFVVFIYLSLRHVRKGPHKFYGATIGRSCLMVFCGRYTKHILFRRHIAEGG
jgi:uncharacterized membrane protein